MKSRFLPTFAAIVMCLAACSPADRDSTSTQQAQSGETAAPTEPSTADPFAPLRVLSGDWVGSTEGRRGGGTVRRAYAFVLDGRFLHETSIATYSVQATNPPSEAHEHWRMFSYDGQGRTIVLHEFLQEAVVNEYVLSAKNIADGRLAFDGERVEHGGRRWNSRVTIEILSVDEFIETVELTARAKRPEVYSRSRFKRFKGLHCADNPILADMTEQYGILVLLAAADIVAGADSVCDAKLCRDWETFDPPYIVERTPPENVAAGLDWVCGSVLSLPTGPDNEVMMALHRWAALYQLVAKMSEDYGSEALGTAAARVPDLVDLLPPHLQDRAKSGEPVGDSLASAQHTQLKYALARCLAGMPDDEMARVQGDLWREARKVNRGMDREE